MLGALDVNLQKIDVLHSLPREELVTSHHGAFQLLSLPLIREVRDRRVGAHRWIVADGESAGVIREPKVEDSDTLLSRGAFTKYSCSGRHNLQRQDLRPGESVDREE